MTSFDIYVITEALKEKEATKLKKREKEGEKEEVGFPYLELLRMKTFDDGSTIMIG